MKIGIISDTHDRVDRAAEAVRLLMAEGAEVLVHCGDLTWPAVVRECGALPGYYVFGNNDHDQDGLRAAMVRAGGVCLGRGGSVDLGGRSVAITHGDSTKEVRRLALAEPDYLLFGHSHVPADERHGATRWINPGALHRADAYTVALLDLDTDDLKTLTLPQAR